MMGMQKVVGFVCSVVLSSCTPANVPIEGRVSSSSSEARSEAPCGVELERVLERRPELIAPERRAPSFRVATPSCDVIDSSELVGKTPFVVAFFATWCPVCEHTMPLLRELSDEHATPVLLVSLDDDETWPDVPGYLARHGFSGRAVRGHDFMGFSLGYNPFGGVPVMVIVGRSGRVLDVQVGARQAARERLDEALWAASTDASVLGEP